MEKLDTFVKSLSSADREKVENYVSSLTTEERQNSYSLIEQYIKETTSN